MDATVRCRYSGTPFCHSRFRRHGTDAVSARRRCTLPRPAPPDRRRAANRRRTTRNARRRRRSRFRQGLVRPERGRWVRWGTQRRRRLRQGNPSLGPLGDSTATQAPAKHSVVGSAGGLNGDAGSGKAIPSLGPLGDSTATQDAPASTRTAAAGPRPQCGEPIPVPVSFLRGAAVAHGGRNGDSVEAVRPTASRQDSWRPQPAGGSDRAVRYGLRDIAPRT